MDVARVRGELQEARTKCASELAEMKAAHAAAAADIAEAAAAHQYMDVAEIKKSMQSELNAAAAEHASAISVSSQELTAMRSSLIIQHEEELKARQKLHDDAMVEVEVKKRAWLVDVQAAMGRSVEAMEAHAASAGAEHASALAAVNRAAAAETSDLRAQLADAESHVKDIREELTAMHLRYQHSEVGWQEQVRQWEGRAACALGLVERYRSEKENLLSGHAIELEQLEAAKQADASRNALQLSTGAELVHQSKISAETDIVCRTIVYGAAAWVLEARGRLANAEHDATLVQLRLVSESRLATLQSEHAQSLEALRSETTAKVKTLQAAHRRAQQSIMDGLRANSSMDDLQNLVDSSSRRASRVTRGTANAGRDGSNSSLRALMSA